MNLQCCGCAGIQYLIDDARQTPLMSILCCRHQYRVFPLMITGQRYMLLIAPLYQQSEVRDWRVMDYGAVARGDTDTWLKLVMPMHMVIMRMVTLPV